MRIRLRNEIAVLLAIKALALALIWYVFFSPVHRMHVDGEVTGKRFGLTAPAGVQAGTVVSRATEESHD
ncbi:MAG TPA: hypothetical protein VI653_27470 [Steroidobacteraceae bacterium]